MKVSKRGPLTGWLGCGFRVCVVLLVRMEGDPLFVHAFSLHPLNETEEVFIRVGNWRQGAPLVVDPARLVDRTEQRNQNDYRPFLMSSADRYYTQI